MTKVTKQKLVFSIATFVVNLFVYSDRKMYKFHGKSIAICVNLYHRFRKARNMRTNESCRRVVSLDDLRLLRRVRSSFMRRTAETERVKQVLLPDPTQNPAACVSVLLSSLVSQPSFRIHFTTKNLVMSQVINEENVLFLVESSVGRARATQFC